MKNFYHFSFAVNLLLVKQNTLEASTEFRWKYIHIFSFENIISICSLVLPNTGVYRTL